MKKRTYNIVLVAGFILSCLVAPLISLTLMGPYIFGLMKPSNDPILRAYKPTCQSEELNLICPLFISGRAQNIPITGVLSNPEGDDHQYNIDVKVISLEQEESYRNLVCSSRMSVPPRWTESFTCQLYPNQLKGHAILVYAKGESIDKGCEDIYARCLFPSCYWLYWLFPFVVAAPFVWWFLKIKSREEPAEPIPDSDPGDV